MACPNVFNVPVRGIGPTNSINLDKLELFLGACNSEKRLMPEHGFGNKCIRCGGPTEYKTRIDSAEENKRSYHEIFQCVDCDFLEWRPLSQSGQTGSD